MPKKDTATAVLGMLSTAGSQTRRPAGTVPPSPPETEPAPVTTRPVGERTASASPVAAEAEAVTPSPVSELPQRSSMMPAEQAAPRTMRLRASTAVELRNAWLEAKRDDVLLTAQDFASDLVDDALRRRRARNRTAAQ